MTHKSKLIKIFSERGYIHQATDLDTIDTQAATSILPTYIGFDCTADSLHVGSLVQIMMLRILQKCGHKPIVLMGGGTTKVGDPSGKDSARPLLPTQDIETNKNGIKKVFEKYLSFGNAPTDALMVDNADWLDTLCYIKFLRDFGAHFSINRMMTMESVKWRLDREQNLSFLEFNYAILQAYDFLELRRRYGCMMQLGGSDQWGNIVLGMEIISKINKKDAFGLTTPLLTTSTGKKMGKTEQGAVWIDQNKYSSYDFYQYWRNVDDNDVEKLLLIFSDLDKEEIKMLIKEDINNAKKKLAYLVTKDCHSENSAQEVEEKARSIFENNSYDNIDEINFNIDSKLIDTLTSSSTVSSKSEAKRLIEGGGIKIDDDQINDINLTIDKSYNEKILKIGKKKYFKIIVK